MRAMSEICTKMSKIGIDGTHGVWFNVKDLGHASKQEFDNEESNGNRMSEISGTGRSRRDFQCAIDQKPKENV